MFDGGRTVSYRSHIDRVAGVRAIGAFSCLLACS